MMKMYAKNIWFPCERKNIRVYSSERKKWKFSNQNAIAIVMGWCWWNSDSCRGLSWLWLRDNRAFPRPYVAVLLIYFRWNVVDILHFRSHFPMTVDWSCLWCRKVAFACWCSCLSFRLSWATIAICRICWRCSSIRCWRRFGGFCSWARAIDSGCICVRDARDLLEFCGGLKV